MQTFPLIQLTVGRSPWAVNPHHILSIEPHGEGGSVVTLSNRENRKVKETVEEVASLANAVIVSLDQVQAFLASQTVSAAPEGEQGEGEQGEEKKPEGEQTASKPDHPAKTRETKPATPPETK